MLKSRLVTNCWPIVCVTPSQGAKIIITRSITGSGSLNCLNICVTTTPSTTPPTPNVITEIFNYKQQQHYNSNNNKNANKQQFTKRSLSLIEERTYLSTCPDLCNHTPCHSNCFEFPKAPAKPTTTTLGIEENIRKISLSSPSLATTTAVALAAATVSTCGVDAATTKTPLPKTNTTSGGLYDCAPANNSPKGVYYYQHHHHHHHHQYQRQLLQQSTQRASSTLIAMGRREIKRSNTSGSTSKTYEGGSATTNLVGKFTQSVRRIVQDVKDEGAPSGMSREEVIETNERLRSLRIRLEESYDTAKKALITLMNKYGDSKSQRNVFQRYPMLKLMIKDVIRLETQYWTLIDIPRQEKQETVPSYVMRACSIMEKTQKSGEGVKTSARLAEEAAEKRERLERLDTMTTAQIEHENTQLINDLYRLLKKYLGLRHLIRVLKEEYGSSKLYPIFPRYTMLKDMIKGIMHDPDYMEVCHEVNN